MLIFSSAKSCIKIYVSRVDVCRYLLQCFKQQEANFKQMSQSAMDFSVSLS